MSVSILKSCIVTFRPYARPLTHASTDGLVVQLEKYMNSGPPVSPTPSSPSGLCLAHSDKAQLIYWSTSQPSLPPEISSRLCWNRTTVTPYRALRPICLTILVLLVATSQNDIYIVYCCSIALHYRCSTRLNNADSSPPHTYHSLSTFTPESICLSVHLLSLVSEDPPESTQNFSHLRLLETSFETAYNGTILFKLFKIHRGFQVLRSKTRRRKSNDLAQPMEAFREVESRASLHWLEVRLKDRNYTSSASVLFQHIRSRVCACFKQGDPKRPRSPLGWKLLQSADIQHILASIHQHRK